MKKLAVEKAVRIPGTDIILERGDRFVVIKSMKESIPSKRINVPYEIAIPKYSQVDPTYIPKDASVRYEEVETEAGFQIVLYYNYLKHLPFDYEKVPVLFSSREEAIAKGWSFEEDGPTSILNAAIPAPVQEAYNRVTPYNYKAFFFKKQDIRTLYDFEGLVNKIMKDLIGLEEVSSIEFKGVEDHLIDAEGRRVILSFELEIEDTNVDEEIKFYGHSVGHGMVKMNAEVYYDTKDINFSLDEGGYDTKHVPIKGANFKHMFLEVLGEFLDDQIDFFTDPED